MWIIDPPKMQKNYWTWVTHLGETTPREAYGKRRKPKLEYG
jgi:hypothetical protein